MAHDVFISYASSDKAVADAVCSQLESLHRIRCWIAPRDVTPGASWAESIIDALDGSKVMVLIFSSKANASMQIEREVERAVHKGINIIPLRIENTVPTKTLEYFISSPHWLDAISVPLERHINKLAASVKALLSKQGIHTEAHQAPAQPAAAFAGGCSCGCSGARRCRGFTSPRGNGSSPAVITVGVAAAALVAGITWGRAQRGSDRSADADAVTMPAAMTPSEPAKITTPETGTAVAPAPAAAPSPVPPAAVADATKPTTKPASAPATATPDAAVPPPSTTVAATPAAAAVPRNPNLFIDFRNTITEGSVTLEVNGETKWTSKLGTQMRGTRTEVLQTALNLSPGKYEITATLRTPEGKVRDTDVNFGERGCGHAPHPEDGVVPLQASRGVRDSDRKAGSSTGSRGTAAKASTAGQGKAVASQAGSDAEVDR